MKKVNVVNFTPFLANLKLNKFDKEIRAAIITNSLLANKISKDFEETVQEARKRYFDGLDEEINLLLNYRKRYTSASPDEKIEIEKEILSKCIRALSAEKEFADFVNNVGNEDVETNFTKFDRDVFVDQCAEADIEITVSTLELLNELFN